MTWSREPRWSKLRDKMRRRAVAIWVAVFVALLAALAYPIGTGMVRLLVVVAVPVLWIFAIIFTWQRKVVAISTALAGLLVVVFAALPGQTPDPLKLRQAYLNELRAYKGSPYVWGGENRMGIDCSGLVRKALINAHFQVAVSTLNPTAMRTAFDLWWHDCSAQALSQQYRGFTTAVFNSTSANAAQEPSLQPGDIGVTMNGVHVLAYLGEDEWIQAEPELGEVVTFFTPSNNTWMNQPLRIMRWKMLQRSHGHP